MGAAADPLDEHPGAGLGDAELTWEEPPDAWDPDPDTLMPDYGIPVTFSDDEHPAPGLGEGEAADGTQEPGQAPPEAPAETPAPTRNEHPDNFSFLDLPRDQRDAEMARLATEDPDRLARGLLRRVDHTKKTTDVARERDRIEVREQELLRREEALRLRESRPGGSAPTGPETGPAVQVDQDVVDATYRWALAFAERQGREPNVAEAGAFAAQYAANKLIQPRIDSVERTLLERQAQAMRQTAEREYEALCDAYPEATSPEVAEAVTAHLRQQIQRGIPVEEGDVRRAFLALYGDAVIASRTQHRGQAREAQATRAKSGPTIAPPAPAPEGTREKPTSDLDQIAERQRRNPTLRSLLAGLSRT